MIGRPGLLASMMIRNSSTSILKSVGYFRRAFCQVTLLFFCLSALALQSGTLSWTAEGLWSREHGYQPPHRLPPHSDLPTRAVWRFSDTPDFCQELVAHPVANLMCPNRSQETQRCPDGRASMMGQFKQDYFLYTEHFKKLNRRGIYLDVAANHPTHLSNTYFMDRCLGWDGLCVEGNPSYYKKLTTNRTCHVLSSCVSDKDGQNVTFILGGGSGGIAETNKHTGYWEKAGVKHEQMTLSCTTMAKALRNLRVRTVDYLSLDVEGHELNVLKGFDWGNVVIKVMTIEVSTETLPPIQQYLEKKGYIRFYPDFDDQSRRSGLIHIDAVFIHKTVKFGEPV